MPTVAHNQYLHCSSSSHYWSLLTPNISKLADWPVMKSINFIIIFITWVNHHNTLKLIDKSSPSFIYANGVLLFSIVIIPFPTSLLGEYIFTNHAAPAVVLYTSVNILQAIAWILLSHAALKPNPLTRNEKSTLVMQENSRKGYYSLIIYSLCAIAAFWFPLTIAILISIMWIGWSIVGIKISGE